MSASQKIKQMLIFKGMKAGDLATLSGTAPRVFYNKLSRDTMSFAEVERLAALLDCEVIIKDRKSGKEY